MAQIRETIEILTKILKENGTSKIKAETLRQAKFNSPEATEPLWKLLFELIYFCNYGKIDDIAMEASAKLSKGELVAFVKREIQERGFHSKTFSALPTDMSWGSRELLLAFGWLFCRESILDKFMNQCSSPIEEGTEELYQTRKSSSDGCLVRPLSLNCTQTPAGKVQQLLLLNGKLRLNLRSLFALQTQNYRTLHQIHEATKGVTLSPSRDHLSAVEVQLFKHPDVLKRVLHLLEKDNIRLQNLLNWQTQEETFWMWMESVLDLKIRDLKDEQQEESSVLTVYNIAPDGVSKMLNARKNLQETILMYESLVEQLEELWDSKKASVSEEELDNLLVSLDMELSLQKARILHCSQNSFAKQRAANLSYVPTQKKKTLNHKFEQLSEPQNNSQDILYTISSLEDHLQGLEARIEDQQKYGRSKLETMAADLPDVISIPPLGHREYV